ncbi:endonuclease/exonuclease/phosphatase family protein [Colwellia sp. MSW7]|uniref:Endonuclease/exonuclease/phosphatase family protein n=1 Tax=Colwellia maritima TaxID=2912588 RepID=A0ABS9X2N3_9GAMM|nr:endonuclease/exonuclease/phosphatase family protein [Colwellia maritima]MCI2284496.1 endonuclease/exonuclease/phosphatase family protein [Colwellia maritima]
MTNAIATQIPTKALTSTKLRVATFNVSMEALNYVERIPNKAPQVSGKELTQALKQNSLQIRNIAEIIQRIRPDIILLNEFDRVNNKHDNIRYFIDHYLGKKQNGQESITYPYFYQGPVNTGVKINSDLNKDGIVNQQPSDTHGFGYFEGHFGMVLLSKYPIDEKAIRTFQHFKWHDMPNALMPIDPSTRTTLV